MTNIFLSLHSVSYALPDGRVIFSDLTETFDTRHTGLVGRNGVGKTLLGKILNGELAPSSGRCTSHVTVYYLSQRIREEGHATVADLAGLSSVLAALQRVESGNAADDDFDKLDGRWDIRQQLRENLERYGLGHLIAGTPTSILSGGETMRVALLGAMLSDADFLILDEPTNHIDQPSRQELIRQLQQWTKGLLVISHDRQLLETMERIVELSSLGLHSYGGNYSFYALRKSLEQENARSTLAQCKLEQKRQENALREQQERQARREAHGSRNGRGANQAKILLGRQKSRSQETSGKIHQQMLAAREQLNEQVRSAAQKVEDEVQIRLHNQTILVGQRQIILLEDLQLPFLEHSGRLSLSLHNPARVAITGPNGSGKSTLLEVLAGRQSPLAGTCLLSAKTAYLDQHLTGLLPDVSVLEQIQNANPTADKSELRTKLAHIGLDAGKITIASRFLSGGERLKAALACVLYAAEPPNLLLLDEPDNHLDIHSLTALESLLSSYQGSLLVVSHDEVFLDKLGLTDRLLVTTDGWRLSAWSRC